MRILLIVHQFFPEYRTGTEVLTLEMARGLRRNGHDVEVLAGAPEQGKGPADRPWLARDLYDGITVHRLHYDAAPAPDPVALDTSAPERVELVARVVREQRPDLVHVTHCMGLSSAIIPAIRALGVPVVHTATDYWAICPQYTLLRQFDRTVCEGPADGVDCVRCRVPGFAAGPRRVAALAARVGVSWPFGFPHGLRQAGSLVRRPRVLADHVNHASLVLSATRFLADMLIRNGIDGDLVRVIPYGVDIGETGRRPAVPTRFTPEDPLRLGFLGTFFWAKGPDVLLDAVARLGDRARAVSVTLHGAGRGDAYERSLRAKAERLTAGVAFGDTFPHEQIGAVVSGFHALVVPSLWYESTPLVLCAALAAGTPVLASRLGGMTELVEDGVNGLTFPPGDAARLAAILGGLLEDPGRVAALQRATAARKRFTAAYVADLESAYADVRRAHRLPDPRPEPARRG